jgi:hypothetical protein
MAAAGVPPAVAGGILPPPPTAFFGLNRIAGSGSADVSSAGGTVLPCGKPAGRRRSQEGNW